MIALRFAAPGLICLGLSYLLFNAARYQLSLAYALAKHDRNRTR